MNFINNRIKQTDRILRNYLPFVSNIVSPYLTKISEYIDKDNNNTSNGSNTSVNNSNGNNRTANSSAKKRNYAKIFGITGGVMSGGSAAVIILFPIILNFIMEWQMVIKPGNIFTYFWSEPPIPVTINLYMWNLENPEEFKNGAKPRMREMGPYAYQIWAKHEITGWGENGDTVEYYLSVKLYFDAERSVGQLSDRLTLLNAPVVVGVSTTKRILNLIPFSFTVEPIVFGFMNAFFWAHGESLIKECTVEEFFHGHYMSMLTTADFLLKPLRWLGIEKLIPEIKLIEHLLETKIFGLIHFINNTKIGPYELYTGLNDRKMFNKYRSWRGRTSLSTWDDPKCNMMNGTEGVTIGKRFIEKDEKYYIFLGDACRSFHASYRELSFFRGIPAWRYEFPPSLFASPDKNPDNKCFCNTPDDYQMCDGIYDIGPCQLQAAVTLSLPHFLYSSDKIQSSVIGINPDQEKHETWIDVNHILGVPVGGRLRLQINFVVKPVSTLFSFGGLPDMYYPFLWIEVLGSAEGILEWLLRLGMYSLFAIYYGPYFLFFAGFPLLGIAGYLKLTQKPIPPNRETTPLEVFDSMDQQMRTKAQQLYPNIYINDEELITPYSQMQRRNSGYNNRIKSEAVRQQSIQSRDSSRQLSPPGLIE